MRGGFLGERLATLATAILMSAAQATAENAPGVTDTQILIGQTMPYSGPASAYAAVGKAEIAYFQMINDEGGINGRKVRILSHDDGYSPPRTVEQIRKLVEEDRVAFVFSSLGTGPNVAIRKYLNNKGIPQLFVASGADMWGDYQHYPWTIGMLPSYRVEAKIYAHYIDRSVPDAKVAFLYQHDDAGRDSQTGLHQAWDPNYTKHVIQELSYEVTAPTVESEIVTLHASGANVLFVAATPKFAAQAIRKVAELGWHPTFFVNYPSSSVAAVLKPAGFENAKGLMTAQYSKDPTDPRWNDDAGMKQWRAFMNRYLPTALQTDSNYIAGYQYAETLAKVLAQCGNDLSRANIMHQAANIHDLSEDVLLPGIVIDTSPTNFHPVRQMQLTRFDGRSWVLFGDVIAAK
jgi:branched-chain amino acid transport system substrate-binding protein